MQRFCPALLLLALTFPSNAAEVHVERLPEAVYRPQVIVDDAGTIHVVHSLHGKANRGELRYSRKRSGDNQFSEPIKVNSTPNCAAGFNMAVGKNGRVHVLIRPTAGYSAARLGRKPKFVDLKYMLYCRLNDDATAFDEEVDVSANTYAFEGVGAIVPDGKGTVRIFWHGLTEPGPESTRRIFMATSADEGRSFSPPQPLDIGVVGACACCSMRGGLDAAGRLQLIFRNALDDGSKNSWLLTSADNGRTFSSRLLGEWPDAGCPGSTYSLSTRPNVVAAWDNQGHVYFVAGQSKVVAPSGKMRARAPLVTQNANGDILFAWAEAKDGRGFVQGATLAWQVFDKHGHPLTEKQTRARAVARWSMPAAYARPDGTFVLLHDGPPAAAD